MSIRAEMLLDRFPQLLHFLSGDKSAVISGPASQVEPKPGAIAFVSDEHYLDALLDSDVSTIVVHEKLAPKIADRAAKKTLFSSKNPYLAMAKVNAEFFPLNYNRPQHGGHRLHPSAVIAKSAVIAEDAVIGPHAVIAEDVHVGPRTYIGSGTVVETKSRIGADCMIHPQVYIGHSCEIGDRVEIKPHTTVGGDGYGYAHDEKGFHHRITHYGKVIIENDVHIGANVCIDRGTYEPSFIGANTKIDNQCHFGHNIRIGKNCLITAGMITAGSAVIGDNCVFGGRVSMNGHIEVVSGTTVAALSGITNSITEPGMYGGYPPMEYKTFRKAHASLASLPRIRRQVAKLMKAVGLKDEGEE